MPTLARALVALLMATAPGGGAVADAPTTSRAVAPAPSATVPGVRGTSVRTPFRVMVDMPTFMAHVLTPAATIVWRTNGFVSDATGDHDLAPKTDAEWELVVTGAATLAEATNALMIPQRALDGKWNGYVRRLATLAEQAYRAAERHDLKAISEISDRLDATCTACHKHYGLE